MRAAIAGFLHESNTFSSEATTLRQFEEASLHRGQSLIPVWEEAHHELGGFIQGCRDHDFEIVPILAAWATPAGPVARNTYEEIVGDMLSGVARSGRIDGLLLALHGAMVAEGFPDADGETLGRLRAALGPELPIILSLDMHANISERMIENATATVVYRTYPHLDQRERGLECARILDRVLRCGGRPVQALRKPPMLIHIVRQYTGSGAMAELMEDVARVGEADGILSASFAPGYIYADVPEMGCSAVVVANGDCSLADRMADRLERFAWDRREPLNARLPDPATAVRIAAETPGLVSLMDCGDNIGGGGPGDSTHLFAEILRQELSPALVVLYDPTSAAQCRAKGVGAMVEPVVGGKTDDRHGQPIPIRGMVRLLAEGRFTEPEPRHGGLKFFDQGLTAVVDTEAGHTLVLNSLRVMPTSLQQLLSLGIDPGLYNVVVVKGATAPRAAYEPISARVIPVDTPGITQAGPESFVYHNRRKPLYPLERDS
ncbi:MAG: hypothetical protein GHCLOJNM_04132 [bacterium]|nr:hypothetical protein [bacterium]